MPEKETVAGDNKKITTTIIVGDGEKIDRINGIIPAVPVLLSPTTTTTTTIESDEMKRANAKKLIERYFYQLSDGCGKTNCSNRNCASSGICERLQPDQAAARAIQLYTEEAVLCEMHPSKVARTDCHQNASLSSTAATSSSSPSASRLASFSFYAETKMYVRIIIHFFFFIAILLVIIIRRRQQIKKPNPHRRHHNSLTSHD